MENQEMTLNEYQEKAMTTCLPSSENFSYMMLNLVGEVGEFASKVAKAIRKNQMYIGGRENHLCSEDIPLDEYNTIIDGLQKEAGDIMWQLAGLCEVMGWSMEDIARMNLEKLSARKKMGMIVGNGDGIIRDK